MDLTNPDFDPYGWLFAELGAHLNLESLIAAVTWALAPTQRTNTTLACLAIVAFLVSRWGMRRRGNVAQNARQRDDEREIARPRNTPSLQRLWWHIRRPVDVMYADGLVINRSRKPHCAWLGPTGAGKSSAVAAVRIDGARPTLCAMPDVSDPLLAATRRLDGFTWRACESSVPVNFLIGTPTEVAERLTEVFRSGGVGAWKREVRMRTAMIVRELDADGTPRTLHEIGERLREDARADKNLATVAAGWVARFLDLADQFGDSIGPDGVDIAELLRDGRTVLFDNDSFEHPSLGGDVVALALAEAKRCANLVPGGFRLVFEEAGQLAERIDLAEPFLRAGRRRKITVDMLTQSENDMNDGILANTATYVYFGQQQKSLQKVAADRLGLEYRELDPASMKDFTAWVAHERIRRLVRFPKPPTAPRRGVSATDIVRDEVTDVENGRGSRMRVVEISSHRDVPALPAPGSEYTDLMRGIYRQGECERWSGKHDRAGHITGCKSDCKKRHAHRVGCTADCVIQEHLDNCYGLVWWPLTEPTETRTHEWQRIHRVRWRMAYGPIPLDPESGKPLTIDHRRTCAKDCSKLEHLNGPVTRSENAKRSWRVGRT